MKQEQLQAIRERCEKATPGPWAVTTLMSRTLEIWQGIDNSCICRIIASGTAQDAEFIARAREDIPALLAEVERLQKEREAWYKALSVSSVVQRQQQEIERLREENKWLKKLLYPFATKAVSNALYMYYKGGHFESDEFDDLDKALDMVDEARKAFSVEEL